MAIDTGLYFYLLVKMHALISHSRMNCRSCVAAKGVMYFSCVASAAHFLFIKYLLKPPTLSVDVGKWSQFA